ncbi:uncharacterized protein EV422DRAFT_89788 [Fimicolochytrium jonesii]|uniref:uncharacterized protein n=1 Tax=Fimicolochytrium jonesii TaxID=1396493 RepID=UPI0022FE2D7C|nr:uncharacterized protein EV422DRAFT_89788 [Fimicolochytrium jonesii]KAI8819876.1 hypothetical protein EV422DRAFT_89788 [Fimicolochytrium jonesii]
MRRDDMTLNFFFPPETAANVKRNIPYVRESSGAQISVKSSHLVIKGGVAAVHKAQCRLAAYTSPTKERSIPYAILLKMQDTTRLRFQVAHPNVGHRGSVNKAAESAGCVDAQSQQSDSVGQFAPGLYALQFPEIQSQAHGAPNDVLASMPKEFRFRDPTKSGGSKIRGSPMVERVSPQEDDSHLWTFFLRKFSDWFYRSSLVPRPAKSGNSSMRAFSTFKTALFKVHVSLTDVEIEFWEFKAAVATGKIEVRIYNYSPCSVVEPILKRYKLNAGCGEPTPFYKSTILGWCRNINNSWSQWASQVRYASLFYMPCCSPSIFIGDGARRRTQQQSGHNTA